MTCAEQSILIYADALSSPEMRHAVRLAVADPFLLIEDHGRRTAVVTGFEVPRLEAAGVHALPLERFGLDRHLACGTSRAEAWKAATVEACEQLGIRAARVPETFPLWLADALRTHGIEVVPDREPFSERRRTKGTYELESIARAQTAAEAAMTAIGTMLDAAVERSGRLELDGKPLTSETLHQEIVRVCAEHDAIVEEPIAAHGAQIYGHDPGSGPIKPREPIVVDIAPRDRDGGYFADMTRTFVVGEPDQELLTHHALVREALSIAAGAARPGVPARDVYRLVCEFFHAHGYRTQLSKPDGEVLRDGFFHGLGHGVGLEVHERPFLTHSDDILQTGDVIAIEPGLYRAGYGGCRLEDLFLISDQGARRLTDLSHELTPKAARGLSRLRSSCLDVMRQSSRAGRGPRSEAAGDDAG